MCTYLGRVYNSILSFRVHVKLFYCIVSYPFYCCWVTVLSWWNIHGSTIIINRLSPSLQRLYRHLTAVQSDLCVSQKWPIKCRVGRQTLFNSAHFIQFCSAYMYSASHQWFDVVHGRLADQWYKMYAKLTGVAPSNTGWAWASLDNRCRSRALKMDSASSTVSTSTHESMPAPVDTTAHRIAAALAARSCVWYTGDQG